MESTTFCTLPFYFNRTRFTWSVSIKEYWVLAKFNKDTSISNFSVQIGAFNSMTMLSAQQGEIVLVHNLLCEIVLVHNLSYLSKYLYLCKFLLHVQIIQSKRNKSRGFCVLYSSCLFSKSERHSSDERTYLNFHMSRRKRRTLRRKPLTLKLRCALTSEEPSTHFLSVRIRPIDKRCPSHNVSLILHLSHLNTQIRSPIPPNCKSCVNPSRNTKHRI